jgi:hypothetical protein
VIANIAAGRLFADEVEYRTFSEVECERFLSLERHDEDWRFVKRMAGHEVTSAQTGPAHSFRYAYHPVGQGGFASGWFTRRGHQKFHYVYDCGTDGSSKRRGVTRSNAKSTRDR